MFGHSNGVVHSVIHNNQSLNYENFLCPNTFKTSWLEKRFTIGKTQVQYEQQKPNKKKRNFHIQNENCIRFTLFCLCVNIMCLVVFLNNIIILKYPTFFFLLWLLLLFATQLKVSLTMTTTTTMYFSIHSFIHLIFIHSFNLNGKPPLKI